MGKGFREIADDTGDALKIRPWRARSQSPRYEIFGNMCSVLHLRGGTRHDKGSGWLGGKAESYVSCTGRGTWVLQVLNSPTGPTGAWVLGVAWVLRVCGLIGV